MSLSEKLFTISGNMQSEIEQKNELEKWVEGLSSQTLTNLKKTLEVLIPFWEVFASNPFGFLTKNISEFKFEENGIASDVATNLLQSIEQKIDVEILIDMDTIALNSDTIPLLKSLLVTVESTLGGGTRSEPKRAIERSGNDEYYFEGKLIPFKNKKALYYLVFKFLFNRASGEASYEETDAYLSSCGAGAMATTAQMSQRIRNAIGVYAKNGDYPQMIGEKVVLEAIRGRVRLNNPEI